MGPKLKAFVFGFAVLISACGGTLHLLGRSFDGLLYREIIRTDIEFGDEQVVVYRTDAGAMSSFGFKVAFKNKRSGRRHILIAGKRFETIRFRKSGPRTLEVEITPKEKFDSPLIHRGIRIVPGNNLSGTNYAMETFVAEN